MDDDAATIQVGSGIQSLQRFGFLGPDADTNSVDLLPQVPERAVLAYGTPALGSSVEAALEDPERRSGVAPAQVGRLRRRVERALGADLEASLDGVGDAVLYAGRIDGTTFSEPLEAAIGARVDDPDAYLQRLGRGLRRNRGLRYRFRPSSSNFPREPGADVRLPGGDYLDLEARSEQSLFIAAYGLAAQAMFASPPLGDTTRYRAALRRLGGGFRPYLYLDPAGALALLRRARVIGRQGNLPALRYVRRIASVMGGDKRSGDWLINRVTLTLR